MSHPHRARVALALACSLALISLARPTVPAADPPPAPRPLIVHLAPPEGASTAQLYRLCAAIRAAQDRLLLADTGPDAPDRAEVALATLLGAEGRYDAAWATRDYDSPARHRPPPNHDGCMR